NSNRNLQLLRIRGLDAQSQWPRDVSRAFQCRYLRHCCRAGDDLEWKCLSLARRNRERWLCALDGLAHLNQFPRPRAAVRQPPLATYDDETLSAISASAALR